MQKKTRNLTCTLFIAVLLAAVFMLKPHSEPEHTESPVKEAQQSLPSLTEWATSSSRDLSVGIELAKERGAQMSALIRTNPEQAVKEAMSLSEWSALPPEIQKYVETPFSEIVSVEVLIGCGEGFSETKIITEMGNGTALETYTYGRRNAQMTKTAIPAQGIRMGNLGALRENVFQILNTEDKAVAQTMYPVAIDDPGGDSVATLAGGKIFYFRDIDAVNTANRKMAELEDRPGPSVGGQALFQDLEAFIEEEGIDFEGLEMLADSAMEEWTGTTRDTYVIMVDFSDVQGQPTDPAAFSNSLNTTVSEQIEEMSYNKTRIVATVNTNTYRMPSVSSTYTNNSSLLHTDARGLAEADGVDLSPYDTICVIFPDVPGIWWAGLASVGGSRMWLNDSTSDRVVVHEFGHNYGSRHADFWQATNNDPVDPAGTEIGYGDFTDIMGSGSLPAGHFNAMHKKRLGWLEPNNWVAVTNSGLFRVYRSDHCDTTGEIRGLEIQKGGGDQYWVGLRQEQTGYEYFSRGAYILWKMAGDNESDLLDMTPTSSDGKYDGGLALGQTYSDPIAQVHITPTARGGQTPDEWMDVKVNLGAFGGNTAPTASIIGPTNGAVQESMLFTVTASDADGDELAYFWDTGDGQVKPNTPSLVTTWLSGSTVTVSCVVSDMKGGTNKVSQMVALSSPLDTWTQRTSGVVLDIEDIAVGNGRLVAVCEDETTLYSNDGTNWTSHQDYDIWPINVFLEAVIHDGSKFIACGMDYDFSDVQGWEHTIYTSSDGSSWTERYDSDSRSSSNIKLNDVAFGGGIYIAVGSDGTIVRSTDGLSWNTNASGTTIDLDGVSYGDGTFVVVGADSGGGPAVVIVSGDGLTWTNHSAGVDLSSWKGFYDVQFCYDRFLASGWYSRILGSTDQGVTFTTSMTGDRQIVPAFAYGNGTYFAAGINKDDSDADVNFISTDGANWTELTTVSQDNRNAAVFYNGTFITVGDNGSIWQSDAVTAGSGGYANWQLENSSALGFNRDPLDDADFDGSVNLEEYARGTSAFDADASPSDVVYEDNGTYFHVAYGRNGIKADVDYSVMRATNLISNDWSSVGTVIVEDSATNLAVRSAYSMSSQTNEFMRLKLKLK